MRHMRFVVLGALGLSLAFLFNNCSPVLNFAKLALYSESSEAAGGDGGGGERCGQAGVRCKNSKPKSSSGFVGVGLPQSGSGGSAAFSIGVGATKPIDPKCVAACDAIVKEWSASHPTFQADLEKYRVCAATVRTNYLNKTISKAVAFSNMKDCRKTLAAVPNIEMPRIFMSCIYANISSKKTCPSLVHTHTVFAN